MSSLVTGKRGGIWECFLKSREGRLSAGSGFLGQKAERFLNPHSPPGSRAQVNPALSSRSCTWQCWDWNRGLGAPRLRWPSFLHPLTSFTAEQSYIFSPSVHLLLEPAVKNKEAGDSLTGNPTQECLCLTWDRALIGLSRGASSPGSTTAFSFLS